MLKSSKKL